MRELSKTSLFDSIPLVAPSAEESVPEEKRSDRVAKDFVRWCFSFGEEFRNSPEIINLRGWAQRAQVKLQDIDEDDVLTESRKLYLKRVDQMMKRADPPMFKAEPETPQLPS